MNPDFLNRDVNANFSGGEKKRNEILQLSVLEVHLISSLLQMMFLRDSLYFAEILAIPARDISVAQLSYQMFAYVPAHVIDAGNDCDGQGVSSCFYTQADIAVLDEIDSGLDIDALRDVADAVNSLKRPNSATLMVTHYKVTLRTYCLQLRSLLRSVQYTYSLTCLWAGLVLREDCRSCLL